MASPAIRIKVGAALDSNVSNVFKPLVQAAREARQAIEDEMARAWAAIRGEGKSGGAAGGKGGPYRAVVKEAERAADKVVEAEKKKQRKIEQEEKRAQRRREAAERYVARIKDRYFVAEQKRQEREEAGAVKERADRIKAIGGGTLQNLGKIGKGALGIAGSVARGAGVQTDLSAYVAQAVELETRASELSAAAYAEDRDKGQRIDPRSLVNLGREVGQEAAFDPARVLEGLQAFVGKTGDLATGKAALPGLAKLARATGTALEDMIGAAGESAKALGEVGPGKEFETAEQKGKALVDVLRLIAGQGKVGAVELKDLAKYGGRLAAASQSFGGDAATNLGDMGALAQLAVARGGAASAAEAATSVAGFANTLKTPARAKEFAGKGVKLEAEGGGFRSVRDILKDAASKATSNAGEKGSATLEFKKMFANVMGARAADPAMQAYSEAFRKNLAVTKDKTKADEAGKKAIDEMFDAFGKAISADEEKESFDRSMKTGAAQVQQFNNQLSKVGGEIAEKVLPALAKAGPDVVKFAEKFSGLISYSVENPGKAAAGALAASIAKAGVDTVVKSGTEKIIQGIATSVAASKGLAIAAAAITIATVGILTIDKIANETDKGGTKSLEADAVAFNARSALRGALVTGGKEEQEKALAAGQEQARMLEQRIAGAQDPTSFFAALNPFGSKTFEQRGQEMADAEKIGDLKADLAKLQAEMAKVASALGKPLQVQGTVNVGNQPGPVANTSNTTK